MRLTCRECQTEFDAEPVRFGNVDLDPPALCADCGERMERETEEREARDRFEQRLNRSGLPKDRRGIPLPDGKLGEIARQWAEGEIRGLALTGPVGVGKTHLAAAACWHRLRHSGVRWVSTARLMSQLRTGFGDEAQAEAAEITTGTGAVVLDDLDKANPSEFGREVLFSCVENRIEAGASLLVTTNLALDEIGDRLGDPVMSRLAGYCRVVEMQGEDRRLEAA